MESFADRFERPANDQQRDRCDAHRQGSPAGTGASIVVRRTATPSEGLLAAVFDLDERVREAIAGLSTAAGGGRSRPCGVLVVLVRGVGGEGVEPSEDDVTLLTPFITGAGVGTFVALLARRPRRIPPGGLTASRPTPGLAARSRSATSCGRCGS